MYNGILWTGAYLPLPKIGGTSPELSNTWEPLFATKDEIPLFWWLLLDHFNCFWLDSGAPIFVVDRASSLARADIRFNSVEEFILPRQCEAWLVFRECLLSRSGELINIQVTGLWKKRFSDNSDRFNTHMKGYLLPLDWSAQSSRSQKEQKRLLVGELFHYAGIDPLALCGESLSSVKKLL